MKQTAVEWLVQEINKINVSTEARMFIHKLEKQAKEMEEICKQQDTNFGYGQGYADCKAGLEMREPELLTFKS